MTTCCTDGEKDRQLLVYWKGVVKSYPTTHSLKVHLQAVVCAAGRGEGPTCHVVCNCLSTFILEVIGVKPQCLQCVIVA